MIKKFLQYVMDHPTYADNTKVAYTALAMSEAFQRLITLIELDPTLALVPIGDKTISTQIQYLKVAKRVFEVSGKPWPNIKTLTPVRTRVTSTNPNDVTTAKAKRELPNFQELATFIEQVTMVSPIWGAILTIAAHTGCRAGEIYALRFIQLAGGSVPHMLSIHNSFCFHTGSYSSPKNQEVRFVPINEKVQAAVAFFRAQPIPANFTNGHMATVLGKFCKQFDFPRIKFHEIRAIFATTMLEKGAPIDTVMAICGWKSYATAKRYIRWGRNNLIGATDMLDVGLGGGL